MQEQYQEIYAVVVIGAALILVLMVFIVTVLFLYQKRRHRQEKELALLKDQYEQELLRSQLEIQETTFKTIGAELHDNIGQLLSVVKLTLAGLPIKTGEPAYEPLQSIRQILNDAIMSVSDLTKTLHTDRITMVGLAESVRLELNVLRRNGLIDTKLNVHGAERELDNQAAIFLFRIFQEVVNNVLKHSRATLLFVNFSYNSGCFIMEISDNGVGFNVIEKRNNGDSITGVGLNSMYNRAKLIGASFEIKSEAGSGTNVTIQLPLEETIGTI